MTKSSERIVIFWSWQTDSPPAENRNFIEECLRRATKQLKSTRALVVHVDRDTKGVPGTPHIVDTILAKIRACDIFLWDATLVYKRPRPSPNPNVLIELGYALAALGDARIIGVMNLTGAKPSELPFDLRHRRWPLQFYYSTTPLRKPGRRNQPDDAAEKAPPSKADAQADLVTKLVSAIQAALDSPKHGIGWTDVDSAVAKRLWQLLDSHRLVDWHQERVGYPRTEDMDTLDRFSAYLTTAARPENQFDDPVIADQHAGFLRAIDSYMVVTGREMVPHPIGERRIIVSAKVTRLTAEEYEELYQRQMTAIQDAADGVRKAWDGYVNALRRKHPDVVDIRPHAHGSAETSESG
ncbi:MAG: hypothetical protein IPK82_33785 [Polyangiaceae bacterium]|nr:hypothetical protein [Polyangiaceae bacterium]